MYSVFQGFVGQLMMLEEGIPQVLCKQRCALAARLTCDQGGRHMNAAIGCGVRQHQMDVRWFKP